MAKTKTEEKNDKIPYEELVNIVRRMDEELKDKRRMEALQEISTRLSFLFKVIENGDKFPGDYLNYCVEEVQRILPTEEPESDDSAE